MQHVTLLMLVGLFGIHSTGKASPSLVEAVPARVEIDSLRAEVEHVEPRKKPFGTYEDLCNRVYESGSVELITRCFGKAELSYDMWARILPENSPTLNKRNVLIVLRAGPEQWFEPVYPQPVWDRPAAFGVRVEYCLETLRQYIPEKQLKRYQLDKRQGRLDAANRLESATLLSANQGNPMDWRFFSAAGSVLLVLACWLIRKRRHRSTPPLNSNPQ